MNKEAQDLIMNTRAEQDKDIVIRDLAMLVRRLCTGQNIQKKAMEYLACNNLLGDILRAEPDCVEPAKPEPNTEEDEEQIKKQLQATGHLDYEPEPSGEFVRRAILIATHDASKPRTTMERTILEACDIIARLEGEKEKWRQAASSLLEEIHEDIFKKEPRGQVRVGQYTRWHRCTNLLAEADKLRELL